jgi:hypothetical protein
MTSHSPTQKPNRLLHRNPIAGGTGCKLGDDCLVCHIPISQCKVWKRDLKKWSENK